MKINDEEGEVWGSNFTIAMKRYLIAQRLCPNFTYLNVHRFIHIEGKLNVSILKKSVEKLLHFHPILRACFPEVDGKKVLFIKDKASYQFEEADLSNLNEDLQEEEKRRIIYESDSVKEAFDIKNGPLTRLKLYKLSETRFFMVYEQHHIISDALSIKISLQEIFKFYDALSKGIEDLNSKVEVTFGQFLNDQSRYAETPSAQKDREFWVKKMTDLPKFQFHPVIPRRYKNYTLDCFRISTDLKREIFDQVKIYCKDAKVSPFLFFLSVFNFVLSQAGKQNDIFISTLASGREDIEDDTALGCYIRTMGLRVKIDPNLKFTELMNLVTDDFYDSYNNKIDPFYLPSGVSAESLTRKDIFSEPAISPVIIDYIPIPTVIKSETLKLKVDTVTCIAASSDLFFLIEAEADTLNFAGTFYRETISEDTAQKFMQYYMSLIEHFAKHPEASLHMAPKLAN